MEKGGVLRTIVGVIFYVAAIIIISYSTYPFYYPKIYPHLVRISGQGGEVKYGKCRIEGEINSALEDYFRSDFGGDNFSDDKEKLFCESVILWENDVNENEKIVYANANCQVVTVIDNDLRRKRSSGFLGMFKIEKRDGKWQVTVYDDRISPEEEPQGWVKNGFALLPKNIYASCNFVFLKQDNLEKIGKEIGVEVPHYSFNYCSNDKDCAKGEACKFRGLFDPYGIQNYCVKKCSSHAECGAGYVCRKQCLYGENGCPRTSVEVCAMSLVDPEFNKNEVPF